MHTPVRIYCFSQWQLPIPPGTLKKWLLMRWHWLGSQLESMCILILSLWILSLTRLSIAAPQFYKASQAPRYGQFSLCSSLTLLTDFAGLGIGSLCVSLGLCLITYSILCFYLMRENKKRGPARLAAMETAPDNIEFLDLTDKENPLFVYVY